MQSNQNNLQKNRKNVIFLLSINLLIYKKGFNNINIYKG